MAKCDGQTLFGFTVKACDRAATRHVFVSWHEQYDFCDRHYFFDQHGYYPEDEEAEARRATLQAAKPKQVQQ